MIERDNNNQTGTQGPPAKVHQVLMEPMAKMEPKAHLVHRLPGFNGTQGSQGERGFNGTQGPPGPSGVVNVSNAYVVWQDTILDNNEIFFRASQGLGTINVSNNTGFSVNPQIAVSGSNVYVIWEDTIPGNADIFFAVSNNNGVSFGTPINLSNNTGNSVNQQIATSGNNVYVTWHDDTPAGDRDIFFAASNNNGTSLVLQ